MLSLCKFHIFILEAHSSINQKVFSQKEPVQVEILGLPGISPEEIGSIVKNNITSRSTTDLNSGQLISNDFNELISTNHTNGTSNEMIRLFYGKNVTYTISKTTV